MSGKLQAIKAQMPGFDISPFGTQGLLRVNCKSCWRVNKSGWHKAGAVVRLPEIAIEWARRHEHEPLRSVEDAMKEAGRQARRRRAAEDEWYAEHRPVIETMDLCGERHPHFTLSGGDPIVCTKVRGHDPPHGNDDLEWLSEFDLGAS